MTHRHRCAQTVWRYAERFDAERNSSTEPPLTQHAVSLDGAPAAVGFAMDVDGMVLDVHLPEAVPTGTAVTRALRVARMEYLVRTTPSLCVAVPSAFTREWLHQVLLSVLVIESTGRALPDVLDSLSDVQMRDRMVDAAREVFGATPVGAMPAGGGPPDPGLINDLADVLQNPSVISDLRSAATALWAQVDDSWLPWICDRYLVTIAAAAVDAIQASCPEVDASDLRCEIGVSLTEKGIATGQVHISEDQPGGVGVIEALVDRYVEDPRVLGAGHRIARSE